MKRSRVCAALLCGAFGAALLTTPASASTLPNDLRHHWAQAQIYTLMEHGLITGYPDHTFRPDQTVTRQERWAWFTVCWKRWAWIWTLPPRLAAHRLAYLPTIPRISSPPRMSFPRSTPTWTTAGPRIKSCVWSPTASCLRTAPACSIPSRI